MTIFVTGDVGFIGGNFVLDGLAKCDEPILNLDKLTYAGTHDSFLVAASLFLRCKSAKACKWPAPK